MYFYAVNMFYVTHKGELYYFRVILTTNSVYFQNWRHLSKTALLEYRLRLLEEREGERDC